MNAPAAIVQECVIPKCHGTMKVVAYSNDYKVREWRCDKGIHSFVELKPGTRRADADMTNQGGPK